MSHPTLDEILAEGFDECPVCQQKIKQAILESLDAYVIGADERDPSLVYDEDEGWVTNHPYISVRNNLRTQMRRRAQEWGKRNHNLGLEDDDQTRTQTLP